MGCGTGMAPGCRTASNAPGWGFLLGARGRGWPGGPQGATYSLRRLGSPWKTLALRQPMRLLERSLRGKRRGRRGWGSPTDPAPPPPAPGAPRGGCAGTYRRFSSGRPRKAPGCTVLIRLFFRSLRGDRHRAQGAQRGPPSTADREQWGRGHECTPTPSSPAPLSHIWVPWQPQVLQNPAWEPHEQLSIPFPSCYLSKGRREGARLPVAPGGDTHQPLWTL